MIEPIKKDIVGVNPAMVKRIEKEHAKAMRDYRRYVRQNRPAKATEAPAGYVTIAECAIELGYLKSSMSNIIVKIGVGGDYFKVGKVSYLSPEQQAWLMNYRIDSENFDRKAHFKNNVITASNYGKAMGLQAQRFGTQGIRGNYFSDYVTDNFGKAEYERYVNGQQRIDAFTVVDGVAHIIEFKTGKVHPVSHKAQVLGYAKGIRDEGYSDIKVHILYSDNRDQNISWKVDVDVLDDEYNEVISYLKDVKVAL